MSVSGLALKKEKRDMTAMKILVAVPVLLAPLAFAAPAIAQERVLQIFGNDKCPANTICVTAPEGDRFRIPKDLRGPSASPQATSWAVRAKQTVSTGSSAPSSCQAASSTGWTGCFAEDMRRAREEAKSKREAEADVP